MLKFGNKEFRNLQEQVEENMKDIEKLKNGQAVLDEFGIKVVGEVESIDDLPTVSEYKELAPDWEYGDAYAVGTVAPYTLYILTRANGSHEEDYWFDIGEFPAPGPQGPQGPQGPEGQQGQTGDTGPAGADAGFGTPTATATMTTRGSAPTVNITATGPNTEKVFNFDFYLPVATPKVTITSASGTLTLADYNILFNFEDSVVVFKPSSSLANTAYTLQRWYANDDYIVFICLYNYTPYKTSVYRCRVDRSNRNYLIYADEPIKINKWNISTAIDSSTNETAGKVLTADGNGGASWETAGGGSGVETVTLTTTVGNLSDADYAKVAGNACVIVYDDNTTKVYFKKYDETSTTITYATPYSEGSSTYVYGVAITKATKYYEVASAYMPISNSNIKSGSTIADKYLKTNGSGGAVWGDAPSQVQSDWNESSQSSPAFIKNKPTIPTVPVTDVTVNGTSVLDGTTAKVLVDTVDGATDGTNWTSLTINGTTADIPQGAKPSINDFTAGPGIVIDEDLTHDTVSIEVDQASIPFKVDLATVAFSGDYDDLTNKPSIPAAQVQSDYTQNDNTAVDYIKNKPDLSIYAETSDLATVATTGDYDDLINKPTLGTAAAQDYTTSVTSGSADLVTSGAVYTAIDNIPEPMIFKGSLGTGGTITDLPAASSANEGFVYKVIEDGTYASQSAKVGDTFISDGSNWVLIPSGDEPSGTVMSVGMTVPTGLTVSGSPITSSGTLAVALDTGYEIPTTSTLNSFAIAANLATVATSGSYADLSNKPTLKSASTLDYSNSVTYSDGTLIPYTLPTGNAVINYLATNFGTRWKYIGTVGNTALTDDYLWSAFWSSSEIYSNDFIEGNVLLATSDCTVSGHTDIKEGNLLILKEKGTTRADNVWFVIPQIGNLSGFALASSLATVATSGSYNDLSNKPTIPAAVTSINGLSGGTLTSPLTITGGDASTAAKISLDSTNYGQITDENTNTLFGFLSGTGSSRLIVGGTAKELRLRGNTTRPSYTTGTLIPTTKDIALFDDIKVTGIQINGNSILSSKVANIITNTAYDASTNKIATMSDLPTVDQIYSSSSTNAQSGTAVASAISGITFPVNSVTPTTETWTFTLSDGTTTTKTIVTGITVA